MQSLVVWLIWDSAPGYGAGTVRLASPASAGDREAQGLTAVQQEGLGAPRTNRSKTLPCLGLSVRKLRPSPPGSARLPAGRVPPAWEQAPLGTPLSSALSWHLPALL